GAGRVEVPRLLSGVLGLEQEPHVHRRQRRMFEAGAVLDVVGARGPGEVVDVILLEAMRRRAVAAVPTLALDAGRADDPSRRDGEPHIVAAEVGEELGRDVELMAIPAAVLEYADLGEPLRDEE